MHTVCGAVELTFSTAAKDQIGPSATDDHIISFATPDGILLCQERATRERWNIYQNSNTLFFSSCTALMTLLAFFFGTPRFVWALAK